MNEWLDHPIIQSAIVPFTVALVTAALFNRMRLSGLAVIAGFSATANLIADFNFEPLSAIKKIILSGLTAAAIALLLDLISGNWRFMRYLIAVASGSVTLWVLWPVLQQKEVLEAALYGAGIVAYAMSLSIFMDRLATIPARAGAGGMSLGIGVGTSALLGASALLGQLGLAIGAACGAHLSIQMLSGKPLSCGRMFTLPLSLLCGLIAPAAMMLAKLPWYCLPLLAVIPVVAHIPLPGNWSLRQQIIVLCLLTLASGMVPILLAGRETG